MSDTQMLQALINGQAAIREDLKRVEKKIDEVDKKVDENTQRIDNLGMELTELSDDAPTNSAFDKLDKRVKKIEKVVLAA